MKKKVAIITGASAGIGAELCKKFAHQGFIVCLLSRNKKKLDSLATQINNKTPNTAYAYACDVTKKIEVQQSIDAIINTFGYINLIICNAGGSRNIREPYSSDDIIENFKLNVFLNK